MFILYESNEKELFGDFSFQPTSFIDTSMLIKLTKDESENVKEDRKQLIILSNLIRNRYGEFKHRELNRKNYQFITKSKRT